MYLDTVSCPPLDLKYRGSQWPVPTEVVLLQREDPERLQAVQGGRGHLRQVVAGEVQHLQRHQRLQGGRLHLSDAVMTKV